MRRVITAEDVPPSGEWRIPIGAIVTPSAREVAAGRGVRLVEVPEEQCSSLAAPDKTIAIGADLVQGYYLARPARIPLPVSEAAMRELEQCACIASKPRPA